MHKISLSDLDKIRKQGFRPVVVGCFVDDGKVLFLYQKKHDLWQLPQGGIDNRESVEQAMRREMNEELGEEFTKSMGEIEIIGEDQIVFPAATQGSRDLQTDDGDGVYMKGKKYFFVLVKTDQEGLDMHKSEFDDYKWLAYSEAMILCDQIYQKGKKRITLKALCVLKATGSIK